MFRCTVCGGLVLKQFSEFHGYGYDYYYTDYFPVDSEEEARQLNEKYDGYELEKTWTGKRVYLNNGKLCGE